MESFDMNKFLLGSLALAASVSVASMAQAAPINFSFAGPNQDLGATHSYTAGTPLLTVLAAGFSGTKPVHLYGKDLGGNERGVGLVNDPSKQHEITPGSFVQLDVQGLIGNVASMSVMFGFNSATDGEEYAVYGSNVSGTLGTLLTSGFDQTSHNLPHFSDYKYYDFESLHGNVLLHEISANQEVPEPASMALVGVGLIGLGYIRRRAIRG